MYLKQGRVTFLTFITAILRTINEGSISHDKQSLML